MNKVLLFGGTGEGRALAEWMVARDIPHTVCVATEYGETLLPAGAEAHVGRMDSGEMEALMRAGGYSLAVDATHPYAVEVTEHIRAAAEAAGLPVLRLVRQPDGGELCRRAKDMAGAADMLEQMPGHVLLTTGSKELHHFARPGLAERLSRLMAPVLRPLFGSASQDKQAMEAVSANVTANLLGVSNAATPLGLRASERLYVLAGRSGAPDTVLTLIVLNATSIQLIPSTVAAVRAACGAHAPFDIMLPVWGASAASVAAVLLSSKLLRPFFPDGE